LPGLVGTLREGYDLVVGRRMTRHDSAGRRLLSWGANLLVSVVAGFRLHDFACGIKAFDASWTRELALPGELHVVLPAYLHRRGARVTERAVRHHPRVAGTSKHSFFKAVRNLGDLVVARWFTGALRRAAARDAAERRPPTIEEIDHA